MILENETPTQPPRKSDWYEQHSEKAPDRRSRINNPTPYSGLGKLPPQAVDLEEAVLGALMLERDAFLTVSEYLHPEHFYKDSHQKLYKAIESMLKEALPVDILTVTAALRKSGELEMIGGAYYITELTNRVASAANIDYHGRIVFQKFLQREIIRIGTIAINAAYEDTTDVLDLLEQNTLALFKLTDFQNQQQSEVIGDLITESIGIMNEPPKNGLTGVGTGFTAVDEYTSGWQGTHLTIIGARPGMGKTTLMLQLAINAATKHGVPVGICSLEMGRMQLTNRMIASETGIYLEKINKRKLTDVDKIILKEKSERLAMAPIHIDDSPGMSITQFRAKAIRWKKKYGVGLFLIDYIQLMQGDDRSVKSGNRDQELGTISRGLKKIAKELNTPVIALSQLSREVEKRAGAGKRPNLSDLRESGNIEQDADNVILMFRPEYYNITRDADNVDTRMMCELIWAKHRDGPTETLKVKFNGSIMKFSDWNPPTEEVAGQIPFVIRETSGDEDDLPF